MTTLPTIHSNGTGERSLYQEYRAVLSQLNKTRDLLVYATLHKRDFYPQGDESWDRAQGERADAFYHLEQVEDYLRDWTRHCSDHLFTEKAP